MEKYRNVEVFHIQHMPEETLIWVSFQDPDKIGDINNGYDCMVLKLNPREIQLSPNGGVLVNQSVRSDKSESKGA